MIETEIVKVVLDVIFQDREQVNGLLVKNMSLEDKLIIKLDDLCLHFPERHYAMNDIAGLIDSFGFNEEAVYACLTVGDIIKVVIAQVDSEKELIDFATKASNDFNVRSLGNSDFEVTKPEVTRPDSWLTAVYAGLQIT
jgi:hypothetical protein